MTVLGRVVTGALAATWATAAAIAVAVPAHADPDIDFANQLHGFGIYGPRDYNAWLGKITCKRLDRGVDGNAYASITFITNNLPRGTTQEQAAKFLGAAITTYCPDLAGALQRSSDSAAPPRYAAEDGS
jgi:hypothetical protein